MDWDCPQCGSRDNVCTLTFCPACFAPRVSTDDLDEVSVEDSDAGSAGEKVEPVQLKRRTQAVSEHA